MVIAAVDQEDFGIGVPQRVRRRESGKTAADDHDTLALWRRRVDHGCCFLRPIVRQHRAHGLPHSAATSSGAPVFGRLVRSSRRPSKISSRSASSSAMVRDPTSA